MFENVSYFERFYGKNAAKAAREALQMWIKRHHPSAVVVRNTHKGENPRRRELYYIIDGTDTYRAYITRAAREAYVVVKPGYVPKEVIAHAAGMGKYEA